MNGFEAGTNMMLATTYLRRPYKVCMRRKSCGAALTPRPSLQRLWPEFAMTEAPSLELACRTVLPRLAPMHWCDAPVPALLQQPSPILLEVERAGQADQVLRSSQNSYICMPLLSGNHSHQADQNFRQSHRRAGLEVLQTADIRPCIDRAHVRPSKSL